MPVMNKDKLTISMILTRPGWTRELISSLLGEPDATSPGRAVANLYAPNRVYAAEQTEEFRRGGTQHGGQRRSVIEALPADIAPDDLADLLEAAADELRKPRGQAGAVAADYDGGQLVLTAADAGVFVTSTDLAEFLGKDKLEKLIEDLMAALDRAVSPPQLKVAPPPEFGDVFKYHRNSLGLSQEKMGTRLGMDGDYIAPGSIIAGWEGKQAKPQVKHLAAVARELNMTTDELLTLLAGPALPQAERAPATPRERGRRSATDPRAGLR